MNESIIQTYRLENLCTKPRRGRVRLRRVLVLTVVMFGLCVPAHASQPPPDGLARGADLAQRTFGVPACGTPKVTVGPLGASDGRAGQAQIATCGIELASDFQWVDSAQACTAVVHEWGHLKLGQVFGGADPWHSTDSQSVMYWNPIWLTACYPPPVVKPPRVQRVRIHRVKWGKGKLRYPRVRTLRAVIR